jgi:hypothetical protein
MSMMDKAIAAWGEPLPDWIKALAEACDETSLRKTATKLAVSPAIVSLTVNAKRDRVKLDFVKGRVERVLMIITVACPVLGVININKCLEEQAKPFSSVNPQRVRLFKACRNGCIYFKPHKEKKNEHRKTTGTHRNQAARPDAAE